MLSVSVVIPLFNKQASIKRALDSVIAQSYTNFELIVVNDASTDRGAYLAESYCDTRVRVVNLNKHSGAAAARNAGILAAKHALIAFLDADDEWYPDFLETVISLYLKYPEAGMFGTAYDKKIAGKKRRTKILGLTSNCGLIPWYFKSALGSIPVISSAVMVPRSVFEQVGFFAPGDRLGEDQDMWCRIALEFAVAYNAQSCAVYNLDAENSLCRQTTVTAPYPVIQTVERALAEFPQIRKWLRKYLSKLYIDYAIHLIRGRALGDARKVMNKAGFSMLGQRLRAEYYFLRAISKGESGT